MKDKMKRRVQIRHEVSDHGKVDRLVEKSFRKEATHKLETNHVSDGFFSAIMKWFKRIFSMRQQTLHTGTSTKSYCTKFGGAFGGSRKSKTNSGYGYVGSKQERRLDKAITRNGGVIKLEKGKYK